MQSAVPLPINLPWREKTAGFVDIWMSACLVITELESIRSKVHELVGPYVKLATVSDRPPHRNPVPFVTVRVLIDAAEKLAKGALQQIEEHQRRAADVAVQLEALQLLSYVLPQDAIQDLDNRLMECRKRYEEMSKMRDMAISRWEEIRGQL